MDAASNSRARGAGPSPAARLRHSARIWGIVAIGLVAIYVWPFVGRGWIPHDEGTIAQSAERVLRGEVPHRDFDEGYTGGLSYVHAAAFRSMGTRLLSLRYVLYAMFLAFLAAVFSIARRQGPPWLAFLLTLLAAAWSVPNYFASMPSWYNLFFATFAALALLKSIESNRARWAFLAGLCAGSSVLFKQVGLYTVAAGLLFLVYREQVSAAGPPSPLRRRALFLGAKTAGGLAFVGLLVTVFGRRGHPMDLVQFVLPGALIAAFLVQTEWRSGAGDSVGRLRNLGRTLAPFVGGVLVPILAFGAAFAWAGSLQPLLRDLFLDALDPAMHADASPPAAGILWAAIPYALVLVIPGAIPQRFQRRAALAAAAVLALVAVLAVEPETYRAVWNSAQLLPPVLTVAGVALLARSDRRPEDDVARLRVFLLVAMAALVSLVQFPFSTPIYFCYAAPLAGLAAAAIVAADGRAPRPVHLAILAFYLVYAVAWMNRGYVFELGRYFAPYDAATRLELPRGGIRVPAADARVYEELARAVKRYSPGDALYAGPDCPEVYFLLDRRNPTRSFFDYQGDLYDRPAELLRRIDVLGMTAVVLHRAPAFSRPIGPDLERALRDRFSESVEIGPFTVLWRPPPAPLAYNPRP